MKQSKTLIMDDVNIYDVTTKKWTKGMPYHRRASGLNSFKYKDEFYVWSKNEMFKYNPKADSWSIFKPLMNVMKYSQEGTTLNDKFYFVNGVSSSYSKATSAKKVYSYDVKSNKIQESVNDLMYGRQKSYKVFGYKNRVYILGGKNDEYEGFIAIDDVIELNIKD